MTTITIDRAILDRLIDAWDSTVLPKSRDGDDTSSLTEKQIDVVERIHRKHFAD